MDGIKNHTKIEFSTLGMDVGVLGAVALALNEFVFERDIINRASVHVWKGVIKGKEKKNEYGAIIRFLKNRSSYE